MKLHFQISTVCGCALWASLCIDTHGRVELVIRNLAFWSAARFQCKRPSRSQSRSREASDASIPNSQPQGGKCSAQFDLSSLPLSPSHPLSVQLVHDVLSCAHINGTATAAIHQRERRVGMFPQWNLPPMLRFRNICQINDFLPRLWELMRADRVYFSTIRLLHMFEWAINHGLVCAVKCCAKASLPKYRMYVCVYTKQMRIYSVNTNMAEWRILLRCVSG